MKHIVVAVAACAAGLLPLDCRPGLEPGPGGGVAAIAATWVPAQGRDDNHVNVRPPATVPAHVSIAQAARRPDERRIRQLLEPGTPRQLDPLAKRERELQRFLQDPGARYGLPPNATLTAPTPAPEAPGAPVLPPEMERLDSNRDGAISREEYFRGRERLVPAGPAGAARQRHLIERLDSRFRHADRDNNGMIGPQEIHDSANPRF